MLSLARLTLVFTVCCCVYAAEPKNESQLFKDIFANYDPLVWPNRDHTPDWEIPVGLGISAVVDLDEKEQVLSVSGHFRLSWNESLLSWDPAEYGGIMVTYVPHHMMWLPNIIIENAVENYGRLGQDNLRIYVRHTGEILWFVGDFYKLYCKVDIRHYPFDTQHCKISIDPLACPDKIVNLGLRDPAVYINELEESGEWTLTDVKAEQVWQSYGMRNKVVYTLHLQRKTLFYVINMVLPIVFLSLLISFAFALPANSGEKMTLCISVMLSYAVFLTLVNDALPANSDGVCYFSAYLATEIFLSAAATMSTVYILSIYHRSPGYKKVGRWMSWILPEKNKVQDEMWAVKVLGQTPDADSTDGGPHTRYVQWSDFAQALDKVALKVFTGVNVLITLAFFCAMSG